MTVFDVFKQTPYTFLKVSRGGVYGNRVIEELELNGIFKLRSGMTAAANQELRNSAATMHVRPEDFTDVEELVGHGIRYDGIDYSIVGSTAGRNFETNVVEHYTLTLDRTSYAE